MGHVLRRVTYWGTEGGTPFQTTEYQESSANKFKNPIDPDYGSLLLNCEVSLRTSWLVLKRVRWVGVLVKMQTVPIRDVVLHVSATPDVAVLGVHDCQEDKPAGMSSRSRRGLQSG